MSKFFRIFPLFFLFLNVSFAQVVIPDFDVPDTVCVNSPVTITNKTVGATSNYWSFCVADLNTPPVGENLGNISNAMQKPVYMDYVFENGKYYGFVVNNYPGGLCRLDFGNSLLNTPVATDLGSINGTILNTAEGIQVVKNMGKWYAVIVGGTVAAGVNPFIATIEIGANIENNSPTGKNWGNIGNMAYPHDIYLFEENNRWYGVTANYDNHTITRFDFTTSLANTPTATNLGNIGNLSGPTGVQAIKDDNGQWLLFVTNATSSSLSRLSFGTSLLNTPTGVNLGNLDNTFNTCWDIYILKYCGTSVGYIINTGDGTMVKMDFKNGLLNLPSANNFGNIGSLSFPHSISKIFRVGADLFSFITNVDNNTITRLHFAGCTGTSIPNSELKDPPAVKYTTPGVYNINLTVDDGLPTQASVCKQVVVKECNNVTIGFEIPDTICVNTPFNITNKTVGATSNYWSFCVADLNTPPTGENLGNVGSLFSGPVFMDYAFDAGNYYGFVTNYFSGNLTRLDFGNSLLNTPTSVNLGNLGGVLPSGIGSEGIQVIKNEGKWYAIIVGGNNSTAYSSRILKVEFGSSLSNPSPIATNWGNIGNMDQPLDLHIFKEGNNWFGFTLSAENNSITRFNFTSSFDNVPTGTSFGNIGNLSYPTGIYAINDNGFWRVFVVNGGDNTRVGGVFSLTRLDFGTSLLNTPVGINLGNPGGLLKHPRDLTIMKSCGQIIGLAVNGHPDFKEIIKFDFNNDLSKSPSASSLGNVGDVNFPHSISKLFRVNNDLYSFVTNVGNNTVTRLRFTGCSDASLPNSALKDPPTVTYSNPGVYNINLTVDDGLPTQASVCKQIVVKECNNVTIDFDIPDTVCVNTPVTITNKSVGAVTNFWSFCAADINAPPVGENLGNIGGAFRLPVFTDQIFYKGKYYVFVCNNYPGGLIRLDFGNSMLNTPTSVVLGNLGVLPNNLEGIQVVEDQGKWYAILVGGYPAGGTASRIMKVEFGADPTNTSPVATNWGNIGNLDYPCDINVFKEAGNWYGFTINQTNNTLTRFNFGTSFNAPPTAVNLGNLGNLDVPTGIFAIKEGANWSVFVTSNADNSSITRLDFGTSLLNTPTAVNLGNIGNTLYRPRDIYLMRYCGKTVGFVVNGLSGHSDIVQLDFGNGITGIPTAKSLGNIGDLDFPHSISRLFRVGNDLYSFITNVNNNTITRLKFEGCTNANIPNSSLFTPPAVTYSTPGVYNINLTINDTLATQASLCKQVVVIPKPILDFSYQQDICDPYRLQFFGSDSSGNVVWDFGDGSVSSTSANPVHLFNKAGTYKIKFSSDSRCPSAIEKSITINVANSDIIKTKDTFICENGSVQLRADSAAEYCWTPSIYLSSPSISNPVAKPLKDITYYLGSKSIGNSLVVNGGFEAGNSGFTSSYNYASTNTTEGEYYVGTNPSAWNASLSSCADHTGSNGRMLLVNGAPQSDVEVWSQTITVTPNTSFEFSTWIQALWTPNPAKLQFSINGIVLGETISASLPTCTWSRFNTNWNSGSNTTATISIVNKNTEIQGNDFALDDISFAPITYKRDSVKITIDKPVIKSSNDTAVCASSPVPLKTTGGLSYTWSPSTGLSNATIANPVAIVNNTTQFIVTGTNVNGCSAKDTVVVSILPPPVLGITKDTAICGLGVVQLNASGAASYQWSPATSLSDAAIANPSAAPSVTTKYKVRATGANGCVATDSVTVQVLSPLVIKVSNDTSVCNSSKVQLLASGATSYQWSPAANLSNPNIANPIASPSATTKYKVSASNGQCTTIDSVTIAMLPPPTVVLSNDTAICKEGAASLKVSGGVSYNWSPSAGLSDISSANPTANPATTTKYKVLVTGVNTCTATDSVVVNILPAPNLILSKDTMICGVGAVPLSAAGGVSYVWSPSTGLNNNLIANPVASPTITTSYQVQMTGANACIANGVVIVKVLPALATTVSNDTAICVQNKAQLSATGGVKYQWTPATGLSNALIANPLASPSATTSYSVKIIGADNCTATGLVTVSVLSLPVIRLTNDTAICRNSSIELKATGGQTYQWSPATGLSNAAISNPMATPNSKTTYKLLVTGANNCSSTDSVTISIRPAAKFGIADERLIGCENQPLQLQAFGGDKYVWSPATGLSNAAIANPIATLQASQTYTVTVSESICKEQASFILPITIRPMLPLTVSKSNDITCNTPFAQLNANVLAANYNWSPSAGLSSTSIANPIANPASATTYAVTAEDSNGCVSTGTVSVKVYNNNDFRLYQMPNAFTPDKNGNNDCFGVAKWGTVRIVYFEIYNRWGQLVFSGNNSRSCWDGSLNGLPQPSGNFVYRVKVETMCGVVERKGSVVLIR